jgi:hypothetical protein
VRPVDLLRMGRARAAGLGLVAVLALGAARARAVQPAGDADLGIDAPAVADEANGFVRLEEAARALNLDASDRAKLAAPAPVPPDVAFEARIAAANERALALLDAAIRAPSFSSGRIREMGNEIDAWRMLARVAGVRAVVRARAGDAAGAVADAMAGVELGQRVAGDTHCALWCAIVSFSLKRTGMAALTATLPHLAPTAEESLAVERALARDATNGDAWRRTWAIEYQRMKLLFRAPTRADERDLAAAAAQFRTIRERVGRPCSEWLAPNGKPRGPGDPLLRVGAFDFGSFEVRRCLSDTEIAVASTLFALRAYHVAHGALPASLDELVPRYLSAVPRDAFDGAPLGYAPDRRILHSVGSDLAIGRDPRSDTPANLADPVFPLGF